MTNLIVLLGTDGKMLSACETSNARMAYKVYSGTARALRTNPEYLPMSLICGTLRRVSAIQWFRDNTLHAQTNR